MISEQRYILIPEMSRLIISEQSGRKVDETQGQYLVESVGLHGLRYYLLSREGCEYDPDDITLFVERFKVPYQDVIGLGVFYLAAGNDVWTKLYFLDGSKKFGSTPKEILEQIMESALRELRANGLVMNDGGVIESINYELNPFWLGLGYTKP